MVSAAFFKNEQQKITKELQTAAINAKQRLERGGPTERDRGVCREIGNTFKGDNDPVRCHHGLAKLLGQGWPSLCLQFGRRQHLFQLEATRASLL